MDTVAAHNPGSLAAFLADRDTPCPGCSYSLRGLTGDFCPECNQPLELSVTLAEPRVGPLIAAVVGPAIGAGSAAALLAAIVIIVMMESQPWPQGDEATLLLWTPSGMLVCLGLPAVMLARRPGRAWFRKRSAGTRRWIVALAWIVPALCFFGFIRMMMTEL